MNTEKSSGDRINLANIVLMVVSAIAAFVLPFHVFLFSYAVLGPLHYLTEISWLHERGYFTQRKRDYLALSALAVVIMGVGFGLNALLSAAGWSESGIKTRAPAISLDLSFVLLFFAFASALTFAFLKSTLHRISAIAMSLVAALFLRAHGPTQIAISVFLPTLIHVFVFTGAFVLYGALKSRSRSGVVSFAAFLAVPALLWLASDFWIPNDLARGQTLPPYIAKSYELFAVLNIKLVETFGLGRIKSPGELFYSSQGVLAMRFIAYAYTYHYLNWFSKTSIIGWHQVSKKRLAIVLSLWLLSVGIYAIDYKKGFFALYCLSFMHVFLEFPLNHVTFVGIGRELRKLATGTAPATR